jgi:hypothetical protein
MTISLCTRRAPTHDAAFLSNKINIPRYHETCTREEKSLQKKCGLILRSRRAF